MKNYPSIPITSDMIAAARAMESAIQVRRTKASKIDTLAGALGEFVFAEWHTGDWRNHEVGANKGDVDFEGVVEVKTSAFPFSDSLNLLVREDYARKRHPPLYVQVIIDVQKRDAKDILPGTKAIISGFAYEKDLEKAPLKDFGSKFSGRGGYRCHYIEIKQLHSMAEFADAYKAVQKPDRA